VDLRFLDEDNPLNVAADQYQGSEDVTSHDWQSWGQVATFSQEVKKRNITPSISPPQAKSYACFPTYLIHAEFL
jgi:hypothetical protein